MAKCVMHFLLFFSVVCMMDAEPGNSIASFTKWFYDHAEGRCKQFVYQGSGGNRNNFASERECNSFCSPTGVKISSNSISIDYLYCVI